MKIFASHVLLLNRHNVSDRQTRVMVLMGMTELVGRETAIANATAADDSQDEMSPKFAALSLEPEEHLC